MTAPYLSPRFHSVPPAERADDAPGLDVRVGAARPVRYAFSGDEFRVGGATGSDLRLLGANLPPLVCRVARAADGSLSLVRDDAAFPILLNGAPLGPDPVGLVHGDRVAVGSVDVTVHLGRVHLRPHLHPDHEPGDDPDLAALLRVRSELEDECEQLRAEARRLAAELPDLDARRAELDGFRDELGRVREQLHAQYRDRRDELTQMQAVVNGAAESLRQEREAFDRLRAERAAELDERERRIADAPPPVPDTGPLDARTAELDARTAALAARSADLDTRSRALTDRETELDERTETLTDRETELDARATDLAGAAGELEAARAALDARAAEFRARSALLDERDLALVVRAVEFDERAEALAAQETSLTDQAAAQAARDARLADRERAAAVREAEVGQRVAELARSAADLEAHAEQAAAATDELHAARAAAAEAAGERDRLAARGAELDALATSLGERERLFAERVETDATGRDVEAAAAGAELAARAAELAGRTAALAEREAALERREGKLREVGRAVAAAKRDGHAARESLEVERSQGLDEVAAARTALDAEAAARRAESDALRARLPALAADADAAREALRAEADDVARRELALESAAAEHRLAVAGFRQQVLAWQADVERSTAKPVAKTAAPETPDRGLDDLRAWYRRRLREAAGPPGPRPTTELPDPGDLRLGELLRHHGLADADTVAGLLAEASAARRPLRALLLSTGAVTLYQLALIESGNLAALALGRLRVVDRVRVTPREVVYRVVDPLRPDGPGRGSFLLRHLSEAEMDDAVRPDEFRQRFAAAREATHLHLAQVADVLDVNGRPAALVEQPPGTASGDWPAEAANPGVWVRLVTQAAEGLHAAHAHGLAHGRLSSESFVLTPAGELKVVGVGEPMWLATGVAAALDPSVAADLRALGPVAFGWAQLAQPPGKRRVRGKAIPEPLLAVVRRLEADPETPMADTATGAAPYADAAELLADLGRLATQYPCPAGEWDRLVSHAAATVRPDGVRVSA